MGATPLLSSNIILPEGLCKESFLDSKGNCVAVQLSALLKMPLERVEHEIDMLYNTSSNSQYVIDGELLSWREAGVTSNIISQFGVNHGMNVYVLTGGKKIAQYKHDKKGKRACLCYAIEGDHAWFYESESVRRSISHMGVSDNSNVTARKVVAHEYHNSRPEYRTWESWVLSDKTPGCYDTEDLTAARLQLLQRNISPGVSYRAGEICALHIPIYRQHIYKTPQFAMSLLRWSDELNYNGYDAPYRGESLASYTHQVVLALVKTGVER